MRPHRSQTVSHAVFRGQSAWDPSERYRNDGFRPTTTFGEMLPISSMGLLPLDRFGAENEISGPCWQGAPLSVIKRSWQVEQPFLFGKLQNPDVRSEGKLVWCFGQ